MIYFNSKILPLLFLGYLIAGVNKNIPNIANAVTSAEEIPNNFGSVSTSEERTNIAAAVWRADKMPKVDAFASYYEEIPDVAAAVWSADEMPNVDASALYDEEVPDIAADVWSANEIPNVDAFASYDEVPNIAVDVSNDGEIPNTAADGLLSREAAKVIYFHHKTSYTDNRSVKYDDLLPASTWQTQTMINEQTPVCPPYDSCADRCGMSPKFLPYTCNCDSMCTMFSDCCVDYKQHCSRENDAVTDQNLILNKYRMTCEIFFMQYNLLTVSTCPKDSNDPWKDKMCSTKIPKYCVFADNLNVSDAQLVVENCKESVRGNCMIKLSKTCDSDIEPLCKVVSKNCDKLANNRCQKCNSNFWPVLGKDGLIYRNSFCARCNSKGSHMILSPYNLKDKIYEINEFNLTDKFSISFGRHCVPSDIDSCPKSTTDAKARQMCYNHTGAVIANSNRRKVYKNAHCAICNGEEMQNLQCAKKSSLLGKLIIPLLENGLTGSQGMQFDDIPAAFSILLNFGLDGKERMYFASGSEKELARCEPGKIWDPFSKVCRKLYCSTEFILVDYKCVKKETTDKTELVAANNISSVPDARAEFAHLVLSIEMEILDFLQFYGQDIPEISETFRRSLASSFDISIERIRDVQFNISLGEFGGLNEFLEEVDDDRPIKFTLKFDLYEDFVVNITEAEPSVDSIVSMLASSLSMDGFKIDINNVSSRIFEIHQTVTPLTSWCLPEDGGEKKEYWNSEFSIVLNDFNSTMREGEIKGIYVNKTGKFYSPGKYVADILFQGYQFGGNLINVSGVAIVCDRKKLNESCIRIQIDSQEYSILDNETLLIHNESLRNIVDTSTYEYADNQSSLWVCVSLQSMGKSSVVNIQIDSVQAMVSYVLLWMSIIALTLVLITYIMFGSLRNLPGCNTMNLTLSLLVMQLTFIFGTRNTVSGTQCIAVAYLLHYEILCSFMWMNVIAFDLFRTFGNKNVLSNIRSKKKFLLRYMAYAYFSPFSIIIVASLLDSFKNESIFAPNYGRNNVCWIVNQYSAFVFFAIPLAVITIVNFIFFILTVLAMKSVKSLSHMTDHQMNKNGKSDLFLYARMALVIGLTWVLSFSAASVRQLSIEGQILTYLFIICNTLQGVFIFWVFVCNKKVYELYKETFRSLVRKLSIGSNYEKPSASICGFSDAIKRTVSNNTAVSTISNGSEKSNNSQLSLHAK